MKDIDFVVKNGRPVSVTMPFRMFARILEMIEDAEDVSEIRKLHKGHLKFKMLEDVLKGAK